VRPLRVALRDGAPVVLRAATGGDAEQLVGLNRAILGETDFHIRERDEYRADAASEGRFIESFGPGSGSLYLVAEVEGLLVGLLLFQRERLRRLRHGGNLGVAVRRRWQGRGVGAAMLAAFLEWAQRQPGLRRVKLEVFATNPVAMRLYERAGFRREGVRVGEVRVAGRPVDLVLMALELPHAQ